MTGQEALVSPPSTGDASQCRKFPVFVFRLKVCATERGSDGRIHFLQSAIHVAFPHRMSKQIALDFVAFEALQSVQLRLAFHTLGGNDHIQAVAEHNDRANYLFGILGSAEVAYEAAIDFDLLERKPVKVV